MASGVLSQLYHQGVEVDALVRVEVRALRHSKSFVRRRTRCRETNSWEDPVVAHLHARPVLTAVLPLYVAMMLDREPAVGRAAEARLRAAEAELERARRRGADLEERLRQLAGEGQAWLGVARSHEAVAAGLRATLDKVL
ncbi:uncharacterized protein [Zea mays]|uniref:uncharacterized protein n=1 Tax=Zea mays TaxID=4577 RepID=UPI00165301D1|nr:uncharacterized protein LOC103640198 [Zea mays]